MHSPWACARKIVFKNQTEETLRLNHLHSHLRKLGLLHPTVKVRTLIGDLQLATNAAHLRDADDVCDFFGATLIERSLI